MAYDEIIENLCVTMPNIGDTVLLDSSGQREKWYEYPLARMATIIDLPRTSNDPLYTCEIVSSGELQTATITQMLRYAVPREVQQAYQIYTATNEQRNHKKSLNDKLQKASHDYSVKFADVVRESRYKKPDILVMELEQPIHPATLFDSEFAKLTSTWVAGPDTKEELAKMIKTSNYSVRYMLLYKNKLKSK